ncbi:hypothetical protein PanWU01x14_271310 [Parasponia andersonii]|uniref:Uncharacterized protein n=1 Tax=Parasponia andersonii TaxID=3476 RepID=A0A2P5B4P8_PARAD|nr:hypothetical protein PanWU01x14_271310 [Parasponia andersonii]
MFLFSNSHASKNTRKSKGFLKRGMLVSPMCSVELTFVAIFMSTYGLLVIERKKTKLEKVLPQAQGDI